MNALHHGVLAGVPPPDDGPNLLVRGVMGLVLMLVVAVVVWWVVRIRR
jgi:hypothetical protein